MVLFGTTRPTEAMLPYLGNLVQKNSAFQLGPKFSDINLDLNIRLVILFQLSARRDLAPSCVEVFRTVTRCVIHSHIHVVADLKNRFVGRRKRPKQRILSHILTRWANYRNAPFDRRAPQAS